MTVLAVQWVGLVWLAFILVGVPGLIVTIIAYDARIERRYDAELKSRWLQQFGERVATAPGDGTRDDSLTLHWCQLCQVCSWGAEHWVSCGAWRDQARVLTVTSHEVTRWDAP